MKAFKSCSIAVLTWMMVAVPYGHANTAFPSRPVQIIVPYAPAGLTDMLTRALAERLSRMWGQQVVTINRPGANGVVATTAAAKAEPDGYTLLFGTDATLATNPALFPNIPYSPNRDLAPIVSLGTYQIMLVVNDDVPAKTFADFVEFARKQKNPINYGSVGIGSAHHLAMEMLKSLANINLIHVPYRGGNPVTLALLSREIPVMFNGPAPIKEYVRSGKFRALAVSGTGRSPVFPEVPIIAESGYPTFNIVNWYGLLAPAGTPENIVDKIRKDVETILNDKEFRDWMASQGIEPMYKGPAEFSDFIASEGRRLGDLVKSSGAKLE